MRQNHFIKWHSLALTALLCTGAAMLASCAEDGYDDDERFESDVKGAALSSPSADDITLSVSADGKTQTLTWPVVKGAGGYLVSVYDEGNMAEPIVADSLVDGCSITIKREEDVNYRMDICTQGNEKNHNSGAQETTSFRFSTFTPATATIPAGTDLYEYFQQNAVEPANEENIGEELVFDLEPGGSYTLSNQLNFDYRKVVLRTASKTDHATITLGDDGGFIASNDLSLNYLNVDASATKKSFIELYAYSDAPDGILEKPGNYYLINYVRLQNSTIKGVKGSLVYDNNKQWCVVTLIINNVLMPLATETSNVRNEALISFQGGGVKDFIIQNSTVYQTGEGNSRYFIRYNNSARVDRFGWTTADHTTMTYTNNTFYKIGTGNWGNYSGISNYSAYDVRSNIWVECGDGAIARRIVGNSRLGNNSTANWVNNTYWGAEGQVDQGNYDNGGTVLTTDPAFADPANGNFTPTGADQLSNKTGDPRWLP